MTKDDLVYLKSRIMCPEMRFIMFDYDGTLVPFREKPELAVPSKYLLNTLSALCKLGHPKLAVVSGRSIQNLRSMLPVPGLCMAGSHGSEILDGKVPEPIVLVKRSLRGLFRRLARELQSAVKDIPRILVEEKPFAIAMHYRAAEADNAALARRRFRNIVLHAGQSHLLRISQNKKVLEVLPKSVSKALAVRCLLRTFKLIPAQAVFFGDDRTDEDAFRSLQAEGVTVKVAQAPCLTAARFRLADHTRVIALLDHVVQQASRNKF